MVINFGQTPGLILRYCDSFGCFDCFGCFGCFGGRILTFECCVSRPENWQSFITMRVSYNSNIFDEFDSVLHFRIWSQSSTTVEFCLQMGQCYKTFWFVMYKKAKISQSDWPCQALPTKSNVSGQSREPVLERNTWKVLHSGSSWHYSQKLD